MPAKGRTREGPLAGGAGAVRREVVVQTHDVKEWAAWLDAAMDEKGLAERNIYIQVCALPACLVFWPPHT